MIIDPVAVASGPVLGVISDTHGLLRPEALERLFGVCHIVHAGDVGGPDRREGDILARLAAIAPVTAVRGNVDRDGPPAALPHDVVVEVAGRRIYVVHDIADAAPPEGVDLVVTGHSHKVAVVEKSGAVWLNPGSAGPRRFKLPVTLATVPLDVSPLAPRIHHLV